MSIRVHKAHNNNGCEQAIESWIKNLSYEAVLKIWRVVSALKLEWELRGQTIFELPHSRIHWEFSIDYTDLEAALVNLHNRGVLSVFQVNNKTSPPSQTTIQDDPLIAHQDGTKIEIFPQRFNQLCSMLKSCNEAQVIFPAGQEVLYQNKVLFFKIADGTTDSIDFSAADELREVFESFWEIRKRFNPPKIRFKPKEVVDIYSNQFHKTITSHKLASTISNLRRTKLKPKPHLKERFKVDFDKKTQEWIFEVS